MTRAGQNMVGMLVEAVKRNAQHELDANTWGDAEAARYLDERREDTERLRNEYHHEQAGAPGEAPPHGLMSLWWAWRPPPAWYLRNTRP
jgi:hypothetical protein